MEKLVSNGKDADTECDKCGKRFPLWDALERKFASASLREKVEKLRAEDPVQMDSRQKGKLLVLLSSVRQWRDRIVPRSAP